MEGKVRRTTNSGSHGSEPAEERNEPVRSRWSPKPEQILILESIFNSGMVNPPKEETIQIRKLLEKFGSVGDANVFYWFQNRRSRSRRRQRQIQASAATLNTSTTSDANNINLLTYNDQYTTTMGFVPSPTSIRTTTTSFFPSQSSPSNPLVGSSSFTHRVADDPSLTDLVGVPVPVPKEFEQNTSINSIFHPLDTSNSRYQSGVIAVFINGVPTEVQRGPLDMKGMFGEDQVLVHSSGVVVPFNDHGFSVQGLHHGESYFLVSRSI